MDEIEFKVDAWRQRKARNFAVAVMMYILGAAILIALSMINEHLAGLGVIVLLLIAAAATGLIVYTAMSKPREVDEYMRRNGDYYDNSYAQSYNANNYSNNQTQTNTNSSNVPPVFNGGKRGSLFSSLMRLYWLLVTAIYLGISFTTMAWYITWLIWIIAAAVEQAIKIVFDISNNRYSNNFYRPENGNGTGCFNGNCGNTTETKDITKME